MRDKYGRAIHVGDVLKVYHFTDRQKRRHYIYRLIAEFSGKRWAVDIHGLATKPLEAVTRLPVELLAKEEFEIVQGYGPKPYLDFTDRPRVRESLCNAPAEPVTEPA